MLTVANVLRYNVIEVLNLDEFELSQNYLFFYDKLEKANYYLETVLALKDEPIDGRLMSFLNTAPVNDGGQWDMAYNLVGAWHLVAQLIFQRSTVSFPRLCTPTRSRPRPRRGCAGS